MGGRVGRRVGGVARGGRRAARHGMRHELHDRRQVAHAGRPDIDLCSGAPARARQVVRRRVEEDGRAPSRPAELGREARVHRHVGVMARAIAVGQLVNQIGPAVVPEDLRDPRVVAVAQEVGGRFEGEDPPELANRRQGARAGAVGHLRERRRADAVDEYLRDTAPPAEQRRRGFEDEHPTGVGERRPHAVAVGGVGDPGDQTRRQILQEYLPVTDARPRAAGVRPVGIEGDHGPRGSDARVVGVARAARHLRENRRRCRRAREPRAGEQVLAVVVEEPEDENLAAAAARSRQVFRRGEGHLKAPGLGRGVDDRNPRRHPDGARRVLVQRLCRRDGERDDQHGRKQHARPGGTASHRLCSKQ